MPADSPARPATGSVRRRPVFASVLCGIDGSGTDTEAARQAAILASHGRLELLSVTAETVAGSARVPLARNRARRALRQAHDVAIAGGVHATERTVEGLPDGDGFPSTDALLAEAAGFDLLVVGTHGPTRLGGIVLGSTATAALHRAPCPVLVAREGPSRFPDVILLADDGTDASEQAARTATATAAEHDAEVVVATPSSLQAQERQCVAEHTTMLTEATGREPVVVTVQGPPARALSNLAFELEASLIVLGSRRLTGLRALGSVSERVAHQAPCSVLVVPR